MKKVYIICIILNMILIVYAIILLYLMRMEIASTVSFLDSNLRGYFGGIFGIPTMFLFFKNLAICYKKDTVGRKLILTFCNIYYSPFYSIRVLKKGWLDELRLIEILRTWFGTD